MHTREQLETVGASAAEHVAERSKWIHRRVEQISFPLPTDRVYRREISIDFTIPPVAPIRENGHSRYYVPLSLLSRWPPLLRLNLRGADDRPVPLLTADQNAVADAALMRTLAKGALAKRELELDDQTASEIDKLAGVRPFGNLAPPREEVLVGALLSLIPPPTLGELTPLQEALRGDRLFTELAGAMRGFTLLWMRVDGRPGDREVVKLSYDAPFVARVRPWSREAFGMQPFEVGFQAPHLGGSGSYHLAVSVPPPLRITDGALIIREPATAEGYPDKERAIAACTAGKGEEDFHTAEGILSLYAHTEARDARFYVSGPRTGSSGQARIAVTVQRSGLIRPGAMAGLALVALLSAITLGLGAVLESPDAAVTTLVVAPALLAYLVVRPGDHEIVGQFVSALRRVLIALGALPLAAATAVAVSRHWHLGLKLGLAGAALLALLLTAVMFLAWRVGGQEKTMRPFSSGKEPVDPQSPTTSG